MKLFCSGWNNRIAVLGVSALVAIAVSEAQAETLEEAFATAYQNNPVLESQRAQLRATDENVGQAIAGYRPSLSAQGSLSRDSQSANFFSGINPEDPDMIVLAGCLCYIGSRFLHTKGCNTPQSTIQSEC